VRSPLALVCSLAFALGCGKKAGGPPPEVSGLAAVPSSAEVVIAIDVARVTGSPLVARAASQLLARDPDLAARWQKLEQSCKLDPQQLHHVVLAIGPHQGAQPGTGPVLLVATGQISETALATCVRGMVGQGGGSLEVKDAQGRSLYEAKEGSRVLYFAFGRPDTVVLGSSEQFVLDAVGAGPKALDNADLKHWLELTDQRAPIYAAGKVDERVRTGLVRVTSGQLTSGPVAIVLSLDPTKGAKAMLGAVMANDKDAKTLESFANTQKGLLGYAAQAKSLGRVVDPVTIAADGSVVRFSVELGLDEVNQLVSALDGGGSAAQDSPPAKP
jgi:hypothetical protein